MSLTFLFFGFLVALTLAEDPAPANPLPKEFINHELQDDKAVPVDNTKIVDLLVHKLNSDPKNTGNSTDQLKAAASKFMNGTKIDRLVRAVDSLNLTQDHVEAIDSELATAPTPEHADKVRRAVEDAFVFGKPPTFRVRPPQFGAPVPGPFRFGGVGVPPNPFFTTPLTSPALDMDLDRLLFLATPSLGIERAYELTKILHDLHSPRSEVFQIQDQFQKNITEPDAALLLQNYEQKAKDAPVTSPQAILESTTTLSGLNKTDSKRFTRAIESLGPLNKTQAEDIHKTIQDHALNSTEIKKLTNDLENLTTTQQTTTPESATGQAWVFTSNTTSKRAIIDSNAKMFSSTRACGFSIATKNGPVLPWNARIMCNNINCAGALVSNEVVLTSASCILACGTEPVTIVLGNNAIGNEFQVSGISAIVNPKYSNSNPPMNIGVIKFSPPVDFNCNPGVFPICILGKETDDPNIKCEVITNGQPIVTRCHQPGDSVCSPLNTACIQPVNCVNTNQMSLPVICHRVTSVNIETQRYFLWGVTMQQGGPSGCIQSTARVTDSYSFAMSGISR